MAVSVDEFLAMLDKLPEVRQSEGGDWISLKVRGKGFGYLWERTETVGLKSTISEQLALVAERPEVFEIQFTAGQFGWVVVHLAKIEADELFELVTEAWCLTAPRQLVDAHEAGR
ncbi:MmcQ/YjbR family DNA-binding protein [Planomonospora sp. ID67723]|nr:MmcQ/YjbR family DNA-binding protein [Planomonospora sp. ID67723]MBG0830657.1 MmcQ/YjbR family DNA-binding protein [Planomonospora sp. ID67723]